ncbi:MAG TPA: DUF4132 domain-containing protein [Tahibacter sp.]|nr:DUF4132 domain-containing protein [Tahibacter sp.]
MALTAAQKKLFAEPDGAIVWDAYMRKREADVAKIEAEQLPNFGPDTPLDQLLDPAIMQRNVPALWRHDARTRTLAVLKWRGADALPAIDRLLDVDDRRASGDDMRLLKAIHSAAAIERLFRYLSRLEAREAIADHARRWPLYILRRLLALKPSRTQPAAELILQLLQENPDWSAALDEVGDAAEKSLLQTLRQPREKVEDAAPDELPAVLRRPPWRHRADLPAVPELLLTPLATPVRFHWDRWGDEGPGRLDPEQHYYRGEYPTAVDYLVAHLASRLPPGAEAWDLPRKTLWLIGIRPDCFERALAEQAVDADAFQAMPDRSVVSGPRLLAHLSPALAASILEHVPQGRWIFYSGSSELLQLVHWLGERLLPSLRRFMPQISRHDLRLVNCLEWDGLVADLAQAYCRNRWLREGAFAWLRRYDDLSARVLIPIALGPSGAARDGARRTLRDLAASDSRAAVECAAAAYGDAAQAALQALLAITPEQVLPDLLPSVNRKLVLGLLPRLLLRGSGRAIAPEQLPDVLMTFMLSTPDEPHPGLLQIQEQVTAESLARFGRALLDWWEANDAPGKERWMFTVQGLAGNDETARVLAGRARHWRAALNRVRAYDALEMLGRIGSDGALMQIQGFVVQQRFADLSQRAERLMQEIADARGLAPEELADRSVPDLGLDEAGALTLDFGPRQFRVRFNGLLEPELRDAAGRVLKSLPKPNGADDAVAAKAAGELFKDLKKQVKSLSGLQLKRLEAAMCAQRRWSGEDFDRLLRRHPLLRHPVQRLVWGAFGADDALLATFRVVEDLSLADAQDAPTTLPEAARIGIVHPLRLPSSALSGFGQIFADYEILQPFEQLARKTYLLEPAQRDGSELPGWHGRRVTVASLLGLEQRGWRREVGDGGMISGLIKPLDDGLSAFLDITPLGDGWFVAQPADAKLVHEIARAGIGRSRQEAVAARPTFEALGEITVSELQRDLDLMAWFVD